MCAAFADTRVVMTPLLQATALGSATDRAAGRRNDGHIVQGLRRGDPEAFASLYTAYRLPVYNFVARIVGDSEDAKDLTQEVFLKAFRQLPRGDADLNIRPWLYRVAMTTCLDHLRARKRRAATTPIEHDEYPAPGDTFEQAEVSRLVEQTLGRLSERHRLALVLKDLHGLHHGEIAAILGVSRGATETLLFRARASFRQVFLALSAPVEGLVGCPEARRAALMLIERDTSPLARRRFIEHARTCPECKATLKSAAPGAVGLALFLPALKLPSALLAWHGLGVAGAVSSTVGASSGAAGGAGAAGSGATGGGAAAAGTGTAGAALSSAGTGAAAGSASVAAASTGLFAQVGAVVGTKIAVIALAATATVAVASVSVHGLPGGLLHTRSASAPPPALTQTAGRAAVSSGTPHGHAYGLAANPAHGSAKGAGKGTAKATKAADKAAAKAAKAAAKSAKHAAKANGKSAAGGKANGAGKAKGSSKANTNSSKIKSNGSTKTKSNGSTKTKSNGSTKTKSNGSTKTKSNGSTKTKSNGSTKTKTDNGSGKGKNKG
jgi:RNA polymerase sigma factor (sigma-70 family)